MKPSQISKPSFCDTKTTNNIPVAEGTSGMVAMAVRSVEDGANSKQTFQFFAITQYPMNHRGHLIPHPNKSLISKYIIK